MLYDQISANKYKTWFLISLFSVVIILLGYAFGLWMGDAFSGIFLAVIISTVMTLVGYFQGDSVALAASGAKPIEKQDNPELFRLVENLAITAGLPTPKIYVIQDSAMNAFATGRDPKHASVAVTTGLLQALDRQELEGVLAHELSHIGNYDIRVMTIVVVLVGVVLLLSQTRGFTPTRISRRRIRMFAHTLSRWTHSRTRKNQRTRPTHVKSKPRNSPPLPRKSIRPTRHKKV